jgi:hypothetical protein
MASATCHPDRKAYARGLCNACYQKDRYAKDEGLRKRTIARVKSYQKANHAAYIAQKVDYNRKQRETARYEKWAAPRRAASNKPSASELPDKRPVKRSSIIDIEKILNAPARPASRAKNEQRKQTAQKWAASNREKMTCKLLKLMARGMNVPRAAATLGITVTAAQRYLLQE